MKPYRTYGTGEVAKRAGVDRETIRRWIRSGELKALRTLGGHWRVTQGELDSLMERLQPPPPAAPA